MMNLIIVLLLVGVAVLAYMQFKPTAKPAAPSTQTGQNTGYQPYPAPQAPWGMYGMGIGTGLGGNYAGSGIQGYGNSGVSDTQAGLKFAGTAVATVGNVLKSYFENN